MPMFADGRHFGEEQDLRWQPITRGQHEGSLPFCADNITERFSRTSVVTLKPAIRGHFKTGQRDWPET